MAPSDPLASLVEETRLRREALHDLIARMRADRASWDRLLAELPARTRLTREQRNEFQRCLSGRRHPG